MDSAPNEQILLPKYCLIQSWLCLAKETIDKSSEMKIERNKFYWRKKKFHKMFIQISQDSFLSTQDQFIEAA